MRTLLIGLLVGGVTGFAVQKYALTDETETSRHRRSAAEDEDPTQVPDNRTNESVDAEALLARIQELEGRPVKGDDAGKEIERLIGEVPTTDEGIESLFQEWVATDDLDKLLALIRALLLKGEEGYPKLTQVLMSVAAKGMSNKIKEEEALERLVPAIKLAMRHEKELVGYVGYLLTDKKVPPMVRTVAMGAAMFLSINKVRGSDKFAPLLLEAFMKGGAGMDREQSSMLIQAMGMMGKKEAVDPMLRMLNDPQKSRMHSQIIRSLGKIGDERAVGPLVARLRAENKKDEWWIPELGALAEIGTPEAVAGAEEFLTSVSNDDRFFNHAGSYLQKRGSAKVVGLIAQRFRNNPGSGNMWSAVRGLANTGTPEARALLEEISTTATQQHTKSAALRYLEERRKLEQSVKGAED